jgi:hypothetical protein
MSYFYVMPTLYGPLEQTHKGIMIGRTSGPPWQRLRSYNQSGLMYVFKYVFEGPDTDLGTLFDAFHEEGKSQNVKNIIQSSSCNDVFYMTAEAAYAVIAKMVDKYSLAVHLLHRDYSSSNRANHELKYSADRGVTPTILMTELFQFPEE